MFSYSDHKLLELKLQICCLHPTVSNIWGGNHESFLGFWKESAHHKGILMFNEGRTAWDKQNLGGKQNQLNINQYLLVLDCNQFVIGKQEICLS